MASSYPTVSGSPGPPAAGRLVVTIAGALPRYAVVLYTHPRTGIVLQMGQARLAARGTTLKSTTLARPEARSIVLSAGPARWPLSAWAATPAWRAGPRHGPIFGGPIIMSHLI
jgi:hypothetical protein